MDYQELKKKLGPWRQIYLLEQAFPRHSRRVVKKILFFSAAITLVGALAISSGLVPGVGGKVLMGLFLILSAGWLIFFLLECFYYSLYFKRSKEAGRFAFELALIIFGTPENDITYGFATSDLGTEILSRSGIDREAQKSFLSTRKSKLSATGLKLTADRSTLHSYLKDLLASDAEFKSFILAHHVTEKEFVGAALWTASIKLDLAQAKRWWGREHLLSVSPIGREWSYGTSYTLMKYAKPLRVSDSLVDEGYHNEEAKLLDIVLSRSHEANAILVGEDGAGKMEVLEELHRMIEKGESSMILRDKQVWVFEIPFLTAAVSDGQAFERELVKVLKESERAGNIIIVIPNMSVFLVSGNSYGVSVLSILSPFVTSSAMQIVAISNADEYQRLLESLGDIKQHFEKVTVQSVDEDVLEKVLKSEVIYLENETGIAISYPALSEVVSAAKRYFVDKPLSDAVSDLLVESIAKTSREKRIMVEKDDVLSVIESKTGIPTGAVKKEEKDKLLNLESLLRERIVGQEDAIKAVSDAIRRARSGIGNPLRPAGSFLFLGPTGVGKTETAKALGEVFFGQGAKLLRLDMSEYNAVDSLNRLIGSLGSNTPGTLVTLLRENPYGVLLLDEFEKTNSEVLNLFLQVIDEGIFSDMHGEKVSARNVIIVATSNAGSDVIFKYLESGKDLSTLRDGIIDEIITKGIFKPELLNRFDGVVLFHPLDEVALREVSIRLLAHLKERLKVKGITLKVSNPLISFLVKKGTDPKFGARPLNRAIQETVEQIIAKKMISGEIDSGSEVELTEADMNG